MTELRHPPWPEMGVIRQRIIDRQAMLEELVADNQALLLLVQEVINKGEGGKGAAVPSVADIYQPDGLSSPYARVSQTLSVGEAASMIGMEKRTIQDWCAKGGLKNFASRRGRCWRIERDPFMRYVYENGFFPKPSK